MRLAALLMLSLSSLVATAVRGGEAPGRPAAASQPSWQPYKVKRGLAVERRPVAGSRYFEYRVVVGSAHSPEKVIDQLWANVIEGRVEVIQKRRVLKQTPTEIVIYDQVRTPVVSDRDYTVVVRRHADPGAHRYQMTFETANQLGPPVDPKFVRIPAIRGEWLVEPDGKGGSRLTYVSFSEPGGSIPAFLVHGAQLDEVVRGIERILDRLNRLSTSSPARLPNGRGIRAESVNDHCQAAVHRG